MQTQVIYSADSITVHKLSDRVYFRKAEWEQTNQCNGGFIVLNDALALVDAPSEAAVMQILDEAGRLFPGKPVRYVFLTHGHWDHADGLDELIRAGVGAAMSRQAYDRFVSEGRLLPDDCLIVDGTAGAVIGGVRFEFFCLDGRLHSGEDMYIKVVDENYIFTGDTVGDFQYLYFASSDLNRWNEALGELAAMGAGLLLCGHGIYRENGFIREQKAYLSKLAEAAEDVRRRAGGSLAGAGGDALEALIGEAANGAAKSAANNAANGAANGAAAVDRELFTRHLKELLERER